MRRSAAPTTASTNPPTVTVAARDLIQAFSETRECVTWMPEMRSCAQSTTTAVAIERAALNFDGLDQLALARGRRITYVGSPTAPNFCITCFAGGSSGFSA